MHGRGRAFLEPKYAEFTTIYRQTNFGMTRAFSSHVLSDYKVIAEVGEALVNVLWLEIHADTDLLALINSATLISLESPAEHQTNNDTALLSIYLYRITEDPFMKNQYPGQGSGGKTRRPPMALDLNYLITPLLKAPRDQQIVLGKIMQVLYDRPTLEGTDLAGTTLGATGEKVRVLFNPAPLDDIARVWDALETPYHLSICYTVRVTMLDSKQEQAQQRVIDSQFGYGQGNVPVPPV
jgi:hypothetical protein